MKAKTTYIAITVGVLVVALAIYFSYSIDQAKIRGEAFGNSLQAIQDDLKHVQSEFYSKKKMLDENSMTKEEFLEFSKEHVSKMEELISRYGNINMPESFVSSVKLFKLSTQKQLESDKHLIEWVRTNNTAEKIQSDLAIQEAFEDEMAALSSFNKAKNPAGQG